MAAFFSMTAFTQSNSTQRIDELTVQRLNVVDATGDSLDELEVVEVRIVPKPAAK